MESVPYRNTELLVKTIPKGTLLFRATKFEKDDLRGYLRSDGDRCILPNHNVFFYPNPFVGKYALSEFMKSKDYAHVTVYILKRDVKVFWLLEPSKYSRVDKNRKRFFMKRCSMTRKGCVDKKNPVGSHAAYNPCLSDTVIKKYPDIVGMVGIAFGDAKRVQSAYKNKTLRHKKYYHFANDSNNTNSIPELILHPLRKRNEKPLIVKSGEPLELNYKEIGKFERENEGRLATFMEKHAVYDPETFFYTYKA
jgi:hypothetical protein